jgi:hypothetical protein
VGGVDVSEPEQPTGEVRGVVVGTEHAAKLLVEHTLHGLPAVGEQALES